MPDSDIYYGDALDVIKNISERVHLVFTSPPYYNARDYSHYDSYTDYLNFLKEIFKNVIDILDEGRYCIINTSPVLTPRQSRSHMSERHPIPFDLNTIMQSIGWQFIEDIIWLKPEPSVKNRISGFNQHRKPLAYKPNSVTEYLMVYRKPSRRLIDWNMRQYSREVIEKSLIKEDYPTSNVWEIAPSRDKKHPAIFPYELCRRVVRYYSYEGDRILDPFCGAGTLAKAAIDNHRLFTGIELNKDYFEYMKSKLINYNIIFHDTK